MTKQADRLQQRSGDIVFLAIPQLLYRCVAAATGSPASHVGIAFEEAGGKWLVAESTIPVVTYTPLDDFLAKTDRGWVAVRRLKGGLGEEQEGALRQACDLELGKYYHQGFRYDSPRQFCSKFVYDAYRSALGIEVGEIETFADLLARNPAGSKTFWRLWFFGFIPWHRKTVTPASLLRSEALEPVFSPESRWEVPGT